MSHIHSGSSTGRRRWCGAVLSLPPTEPFTQIPERGSKEMYPRLQFRYCFAGARELRSRKGPCAAVPLSLRDYLREGGGVEETHRYQYTRYLTLLRFPFGSVVELKSPAGIASRKGSTHQAGVRQLVPCTSKPCVRSHRARTNKSGYR